jgi:uncharacterized protein
MQSMGLGCDWFRKAVEWISYRVLEPFSPARLRLATAAGIEHHNAAIATYFLRQDLLGGVQEGELRRLFLWHFCEEIEHKETVFKLMRSLGTSWLVRALGLFTSFSTFIFYMFIGAIVFGVKTRAWLDLRYWTDLALEVFGRRGLMRLLIRETGRYLRPGFYPNASESASLLASALAELDRVGIERPNSRPVELAS